MENLKIKVENNIDELVSLFGQLGCKYFNHTGSQRNYMLIEDGKAFFCKLKKNFTASKSKEITIPQLRDLVVLKRNDPKDATHYRSDGKEYFQTCDKERHYHFQDDAWVLSTWMNYQLLPQLKPIEKPMKEYLVKNENTGAYDLFRKYPDFSGKSDIEIPEGAEEYKANGKFYKENSSLFCLSTMEWTRSKLKKNAYPTLWQRHTQPEELPFVDDEPCLDDQYEEIERVRQSDKVLKEILEGNLPEFNFTPSGSAWDSQVGGDHYKQMVIQPMEFALKNKLDYAQANVVKYVTRHAHKNGKQDLLKAIHNIELMIEHYYGE